VVFSEFLPASGDQLGKSSKVNLSVSLTVTALLGAVTITMFLQESFLLAGGLIMLIIMKNAITVVAEEQIVGGDSTKRRRTGLCAGLCFMLRLLHVIRVDHLVIRSVVLAVARSPKEGEVSEGGGDLLHSLSKQGFKTVGSFWACWMFPLGLYWFVNIQQPSGCHRILIITREVECGMSGGDQLLRGRIHDEEDISIHHPRSRTVAG
jgi:hypothetical protein